ncbi:MAG: DUF5696 domain-containing protein [Oscillospiraceae bacterium]|jgi:hypothetical protein|nr:DUF5696 domain-containing protein [Oscillospiraceae bacterium]
MKLSTKIFLIALAIVVLIVGGYQGYLLFKYRLHNGHLDIVVERDPLVESFDFTYIDVGTVDVPGYVCVAENEYLRLYIDVETGNIAIYDRRTSNITYAVHPDMENDPIASDLNKSLLQSQVTIEYFTATRIPARMNSFDHSVNMGEGQFKLEGIENGVRIVYTMGDISSPTGIVPIFISLERLQMFLEPVRDTRAYTRNMLRYVESTIAPGFMELISSARTGAATLREMNELFESVGYTAADFAYDMAASGVEDVIPLHFVIPFDVQLDGNSIVASVNTRGVREYASGRIATIQFFRAFGAGGTDETGYLVVPNGSGSLIRFNNGKTYADEYMQYIYGEDPLLSDYLTLGIIQDIRIPFFGINAENRTILGYVEDGDSQCYLTAGISGKVNSYNYIYPGFILRGSMSLAMFGMTGNEAVLPIVERDLPMINLAVRYSFLEENGYSAMAKSAREQLIENGMLHNEPIQANNIPFYMDIIGSVMGQKFFAGVQYMGQIPMTTYKQAAEISEDMAERGVTRQVINYQGWFNRGYYHDIPDKIRPVRQLGNTRELESLARAVEEKDGKLYSDTALVTTPWSTRRYRFNLESSRYYGGGTVAGFGMVNPITMYNTFALGYLEVLYNIISPRFLIRYTESFIKAMDRYDVTGISLRDMGEVLASDRRRTGVIHREEAKDVVLYAFERIHNQGKPIMVSGGNIYSLQFADDLINMPLSHNALYVVDDEIPFYQMIVFGKIEYAGSPINLSDTSDERDVILRLVEYGASPHFTFSYESASDMKYTGLNWKYSTRFLNWNEMAARIYHEVNDVLSLVIGEQMVEHEILSNGLRVVTYSNGIVIVINRTNNDLEYDGKIVPSRGYIVN